MLDILEIAKDKVRLIDVDKVKNCKDVNKKVDILFLILAVTPLVFKEEAPITKEIEEFLTEPIEYIY